MCHLGIYRTETTLCHIKPTFNESCGLQVAFSPLAQSRFRKKVGRKPQKSREKPQKSREKIVALLSEDGKLSATTLAEKIGISAKSVEKHLANLKADGIIERIGPAKGGYWKVK